MYSIRVPLQGSLKGTIRVPLTESKNAFLRLITYMLHYLNGPRLLELWCIPWICIINPSSRVRRFLSSKSAFLVGSGARLRVQGLGVSVTFNMFVLGGVYYTP